MNTSGLTVFRKSQKQQVYDRLHRLIMDQRQSVGERLPAIAELALRFDTSTRTVQTALEELEARGYLEMRHGSGTFIQSQHRPVSMKDAVAVCMETRAHLFGELAGELASALNARNLLPMTLDITSGAGTTLLRRLAHADADCFFVHAADATFAESLEAASLHTLKPIVAFVSWSGPTDWPNLYRVLTDTVAGGRKVARHLHERGHRRVLALGPPTAAGEWRNPDAPPFAGRSFVQEWTRLGGACETLESSSDCPQEPAGLDEERVVALLSQPGAPTAIFGTMDLQAWGAQQIIRRRLPHLEGKIGIVGYYDTPWSRAGSPPFSTVALDLPRMVTAGLEMLEAIRAGREPERKTVVIEPQLVVR